MKKVILLYSIGLKLVEWSLWLMKGCWLLCKELSRVIITITERWIRRHRTSIKTFLSHFDFKRYKPTYVIMSYNCKIKTKTPNSYFQLCVLWCVLLFYFPFIESYVYLIRVLMLHRDILYFSYLLIRKRVKKIQHRKKTES